MARITIPLEKVEKDALFELARREFRDPRQQAALFVRRELERLGLLRPADIGNTSPTSEDRRGPA